ncbi:MAG: dihydroorotate dehydrogenase, partial [Planctomycetes bacterium]|nr:dihydroorotate dehydrogenase [Planctomycetota bacterium]
PAQIEEITRAVKAASGDKPLMVKLTPAVTDIAVSAQAAVNGGADALSLVNTFTAMVIDIEDQRPVLANRTGGLSGPAIKPMAVYLVNRVFQAVGGQVPIMGLGGIATASDAVEFMIAGATTIAVGTATFAQPDCAMAIIEGIGQYCRKKGVSNIKEIVGCLQ